MKQVIITFLFSMSFLCPTHTLKSQNLKAKDVVGVWYGEYYLTSGTNYEMIVEIKVLKKNQLEFELYYPSYFNSKYKASGILKEDSIYAGSTTVIQGVGNFSVDYEDQMVLVLDGNDLNGTYFVNGDIFAEVSLKSYQNLSGQSKSSFDNLISESIKKYGEAIIKNEIHLDVDSLTQIAKKTVESFNNLEASTMLIEGDIKAGEMKFPARMEFHMPNSMYIEFNFQGQKFLNVTNEEIKWEYDPFNDLLTVDSISTDSSDDSSDNFDSFIGTLSATLDDGFKILKVTNAFLDGKEAFRLTLIKDLEKRIFYIDPENVNLLRQEISYKVNAYHDYEMFGGISLPTTTIEYQSNGQVVEFDFFNYQFDVELDKTKLQIPHHLKGKLKASNESNAYIEKARRFYKDEAYDQAKKYYELAIKSQGESSSVYYQLGKCSHQLGSYYEAIGYYQKAISLNPQDAISYNDMGLSKYNLGDYQNALKDFNKAISLDSTLSVSYSNKGNSQYFLDEKEESFKSFSKAILYDNSNAQYQANHGIVGVEVGFYEEARKSLRNAIALGYADSAKLNNWIGISYYRNEIYDSASIFFGKATSINSKDFDYIKNLGMAHYEMDDMKSSKTYFERALKLNDDDDDLFNYLGLTFYNLEDYDGANYYFNKAISINDKNATYFDNRAYTYEEIGTYSKAIEDLTTSIQLYPDDPEVYYRRGLIYRMQHNNFNACLDFKKAANMDHEKAMEEFKNCKISSDG